MGLILWNRDRRRRIRSYYETIKPAGASNPSEKEGRDGAELFFLKSIPEGV